MKTTVLLLAVSFILLATNKYKAQENKAFENGTIVATVGYGFPDFYRINLRSSYAPYKSRSVGGFGPLILKGDYGIIKFKWGHYVGAGIVLGYSSSKVVYTDYPGPIVSYPMTDLYRTITIGARGSYHFFTKEKIDCYASVGLGFNINTYSTTNTGYGSVYGGYGYSNSVRVARSAAYAAFTIGIRYYFTKHIGVYAEAGWDMSAPLQGGLALKF
ncbi:MAG: hypothetical protein V4580_19580 [Bacteroidota bacterium]